MKGLIKAKHASRCHADCQTSSGNFLLLFLFGVPPSLLQKLIPEDKEHYRNAPIAGTKIHLE